MTSTLLPPSLHNSAHHKYSLLFLGTSHSSSNLNTSALLYAQSNRRNKKVYAWTVDDEESMNKMLIEHADAIVTSNPSALKRVMQAAREQCLGDGFSFSAQ